MAAVSQPPEVDESRLDQRIFLSGKSFDDYETLLALRGERGNPRIFFLDGTIEITSPSLDTKASSPPSDD